MTAPAPAWYASPADCPDAGTHAPPKGRNDYGKYRHRKCPTCGFWALLAPASGSSHDRDCEVMQGERACRCANRAAHAESVRLHPDCAECAAGKGTVAPGPGHDNRWGHRPHCSCDGCW